MQPKLNRNSRSKSSSSQPKNSKTPKQSISLVSFLLFTNFVLLGLLGVSFWSLAQRQKFNTPPVDDSQHHFSHNIKTALPSHSKDFHQHFTSKDDLVSGEFAYGGSAAWIPIVVKVDPILQGARPEFKMRYTLPPSGIPNSREGIRMLLDDRLAFAHASRPIHTEEYQKALQKGYTLNEVTVALEVIVIIVHPDLDIPGLTLAQLKGIYTDKITNWKQVGGPNLPITPYSLSAKDSGIAEYFDHYVMKDLPFGENVIFTPTSTNALRKVAHNRGSIFYTSAPQVIGQCTTKPIPIGHKSDKLIAPYQEPLILPSQCPEKRNHINMSATQSGKYPLLQPLFVAVKRDGQIDERAGEAYVHFLLTDEGQELIRQAGFIPIRCLSHFADTLGTCHHSKTYTHH